MVLDFEFRNANCEVYRLVNKVISRFGMIYFTVVCFTDVPAFTSKFAVRSSQFLGDDSDGQLAHAGHNALDQTTKEALSG